MASLLSSTSSGGPVRKGGTSNKESEDVKTTKHLIDKSSSTVIVTDASGKTYQGLHVWSDLAPIVKEEPDRLFAKCVILPNSTKSLLKLKQIDPPDEKETVFECKQTNVWNYNSGLDSMSISDIGMIPHTNVPCVLSFVRDRYMNDQIYTTADPLLLAINPFMDLENTTTQWILKYRDCPDHSKLPPHVFSIARTALDNLHSVNKDQSIIVSGESGAGKTEATKQVMRYFAAAKSGTIDTRIQVAVLAANPVLEAFGNAKTIRNNNSSRFGRFMQLQVALGGGIEYGAVQNFLLEKSRLLTQEDDERSYHIFYQLLRGASDDMKRQLELREPTQYNFLNSSCTTVSNIDDVKDFKEVEQSLMSMGLNEEERLSTFSIVSGVLLLGNLKVVQKERMGVDEAAFIDEANEPGFQKACAMLFLDPELVRHELLTKTAYAGGNLVESVWKASECRTLVESLAKAMYDQLFNWIIRKLNRNIEPPNGFKFFMGMLDIFGFEVFRNNSLEQLFINITNERLQKNFIDIVFERETRLYREEGISSETLVWTDNKSILEALCSKKSSVLAQLEDQCLAPSGSDEKLVTNLYTNMKGNVHITKARFSPNTNFNVVHTIGEIQYCAEGFLLKNMDVLRAELVEVVQASRNSVSSGLFVDIAVERGKLAKGQLISNQFVGQLETLMSIISQTEPHFIRCVKPNETKQAHDWVQSKVLIQLHALSILEALQLKNLGYSYRRPFEEFLYQFKYVDVGAFDDKTMTPQEKCTRMLNRCEIPKGDFQIGKTMIFLRNTAPKLMLQKQREVMAAWLPVVNIVEAMMTKRKLRMKLKAREHKIKRIQWHCRKHNIIEEVRKLSQYGGLLPTDVELSRNNWRVWGA